MGGDDASTSRETRLSNENIANRGYEVALEKLAKEQGFAKEQDATNFQRSLETLGKTQGFQSSEAATAYQRAMEKLAQEQQFASGEAEQGRQFTGEQSQLGREFAGSEAEKERQFTQGMADYSRQTGQELYNTGEQQLMNSLDHAPDELSQLKNDIATNSTQAQQEQRKQANLTFAQQGVRGGQAATSLNRTTGDLNRQMGQDVNQLAYQDAIRRSNAKTNYLGQKATTGQQAYVK